MTAITRKTPSQIAHLTEADLHAMAAELDGIRAGVINTRGAKDAAYIRRLITIQRSLEMGSRAVLLFSKWKPAFVAGTLGLAVSKIIENMELGHNIMHGQWDWMRDPKIHSSTWEWDHASPAEQWKRTHNELHHKYTNVIDMDNDLGYGIMRLDEDQPWQPRYLLQPLQNFANMLIFEYGITVYDLDLGEHLRSGRKFDGVFKQRLKKTLKKTQRQITKDFVVHPLLSGPSALSTLKANVVANVIRNVWSHSVIMCGHFPEGVEVYETDSIQGEDKPHWYLRQMLGSANISGPALLHLMTGNLSHQIEHHLFPDLPSNRYAEIAPKVRAVFERYGLSYVSGNMAKQVLSAWRRIVRLSLPNNFGGLNPTPQTRASLATDGAGTALAGAGAN